MIHPDLQNAWTVSNGVNVMQPVFGGLYSVPLVGYQGHVIPVIIAVWLMCQIEKRLHKVVPAMFDLFVTPLVSVFVTGYLTLAAIGPVFTKLENGITTGTTTSTFSPDATCTRAQAVTFLARALNANASGKAEFGDVPTDSYFAEAVAWAAANGVTEGIGGGLFGSDNDCTRGQIVTFLWRLYAEK